MSFDEASIPDQTGRVAIVTGANSGIGYETARALAAKGARVVVACRDASKGRSAEARIRAAHPNCDARFEALDLGSLTSVRAFAARFLAAESRLDLLINNAGVMVPPLGRTADGFELQFGTNHLGHFALGGLLLERIRATAGARVVSVSSLMHRIGRIDFSNLNAERSYNATLAYGQSKLANLLFVRELQQRFAKAGVQAIAAAAHPGSTRTGLQQHSTLMGAAVAVFAQQPPDGALPTLRAATAADVRGGDYYGPGRWFEMAGPPVAARRSAAARDDATAQRLWDVSTQLTGVAYTI